MKTVLRTIAIYTFILYILPFIIPGVKIDGGLITLLVGGIALSALFLLLKPILNFLSFPANLLTLGLFSIFTNALILFLMTSFVSGITVEEFTYKNVNVLGFGFPDLAFPTLFAYIYTAVVISCIKTFLSWLMK